MSANSDAVRQVVALAGGKIVGKTRLQKAVYVLELAGLGFDFPFCYYHYGPYSEDLAWAAKDAAVEGSIVEQEDQARWGGTYSVFILPEASKPDLDEQAAPRMEILQRAVSADAVVLELAATAALLKVEGFEDCWGETARRKPLKAKPEAISEAKALWESIRSVKTPNPLPALG